MATVQLAIKEGTPAQVREIYPRYRTIAGHSEVNLLVRRRMYGYLADLAMLGILNRQSRNEGGNGRQYYELSVNLRAVLEVVGGLEGPALPQGVRHQF